MAQLKMYRLFDAPIEEPTLPEGYSFVHFVPGKDEHEWCNCLRGGHLIDTRTDEEAYRDEIINFKDIVPETDIWFIDYNGEHIVLSDLKKRGARFVSLTTSESRIPAVKSYLSAGFLPVEYDDGMEERWKGVISSFGIDSSQILNEDGEPYKIITKD